MKVLLVGDYSNLHATLSQALRRKGLDVTLVGDGGGYMRTTTDITLARSQGRWGALRYMEELIRLLPRLRGYDVVQLINTNFIRLRPEKIEWVFKYLKKNNGKIFLTLAGDDYYYIDACENSDLFRFSYLKASDTPTPYNLHHRNNTLAWMSGPNRRLARLIADNIDGAVSVLPEYDMAWRPVLGDRLTFANIPIELSALSYSTPPVEDKLEILVGIKREMIDVKGTDILLSEAYRAQKMLPDKIVVNQVENMPLDEYLSTMRRSHVVLDQLYAYSPATNALQAMAMGKVAGTGAQPEYYRYIGEKDEGAILSLSPSDNDIAERIAELALNPERVGEIGRMAREITLRHNDSNIVASKFITAWEGGKNG